jgi:hypothetical protein
VKISNEEKKQLKKGEASVYPVLMQVNPENGEVRSTNIKYQAKNTFDYSSLITKKGISLYGFFCDLNKDPKGNDTHGIFFTMLDSKTFKVKETKLTYFDKAFLDVLYAADKENQKKGGGLFKSRADKQSDDESIDDNYVIESVIADGDNIYLFCTIMVNWSRQVCNGKTCTTVYYCSKSNVTTFKLNLSGDIVWARNMDRAITYSGWDIEDLSVVKKNDNFYVVYGSQYQINASKKSMKNSKSNEQLQDRFEYAIINESTGDIRKTEQQVNKLYAKKAEKKYVNPTNIYVYDNRMYTECRQVKFKPGLWWWCLCPPVFTILSYNGNWRTGSGYLGTISPIK